MAGADSLAEVVIFALFMTVALAALGCGAARSASAFGAPGCSDAHAVPTAGDSRRHVPGTQLHAERCSFGGRGGRRGACKPRVWNPHILIALPDVCASRGFSCASAQVAGPLSEEEQTCAAQQTAALLRDTMRVRPAAMPLLAMRWADIALAAPVKRHFRVRRIVDACTS